MKTALLIGFAAAPLHWSNAIGVGYAVATPDALGASDAAVIQVKGGHGTVMAMVGRAWSSLRMESRPRPSLRLAASSLLIPGIFQAS